MMSRIVVLRNAMDDVVSEVYQSNEDRAELMTGELKVRITELNLDGVHHNADLEHRMIKPCIEKVLGRM